MERSNGASVQMKKKKLPQVRQTLTSKLRMLKANPLLMHELDKKITDGNRGVMRPLKTLVAVLDNETMEKSELTSSFRTQKFSSSVKQLEQKNGVHSNTLAIKSNAQHPKRSPLKKISRQKIANQNTREISSKLSEWLKRRGKSISEYQNLNCLGVVGTQKQPNNEDKENIDDQNNYENLMSETPQNKGSIEDTHVSEIAQDALKDLHKLILEGYSSENCEIWLKLIKEKCRQVENKPQYWECRAALEQTKGNIKQAVECYKAAIVHGAEVESVDKHLDQLLQKFNILHIEDPSVNINHETGKIVQDARNIFKSSIIQFAVQERSFKKRYEAGVSLEKKFIATPVRRSTRLSRSRFTSTPGIHIYSSLHEVDNSMKDVLHFQCNNALRD